MFDVNKFEAMRVGLASPEKIRSWSYGEVKKPETINYRTLKPERDGLFCERIFGPTKDYECSCGKYKRVRFKGVVCDRCGVEVTKAKVRRERMGHIELAAPVTHIWYFKGIPSRMGLVLDMSPRDLEEIIYFVSYVVIEPGPTSLEKKQLLQEKEYRAYYEKYGSSFKVGMGAEAIKTLLEGVDLEKEKNYIETELKTAQGQKRSRLLKRLEVIDAFYRSNNRPEWMVMDVLPVIPPELRPMIQLDGGRFATSDLNDLYRRVINRNNRLKKLLDLGAPNIIVQNEKRMLQEAVDALIDNGRRGRAVTGPGNRPLKSLTHMLKGKQGRFRQNLLGKRVDYSGRSVIVVGPDLKMYQCGIPKEMALELFTPHIIRQLVERELAHNIKSAKRMIANKDESVWDIVEEVIREHPVLLNRAPTLHRLGIQAFEPKLVEGRAIRLHPLVTPAFNADFDGDQMAVHVPLGPQAQAEARLLMLGANNILNPKDGKPVVTPSQDMVLGNYYLTLEKVGAIGEGRVFKNLEEAHMAYQIGDIHLHTRIAVPGHALNNSTFTEEQNRSYVRTTLGKMIFNNILPEGFPYINEASNYNIQVTTPEQYFIKPGENIREAIKNAEVITPFKKKTLGIIISEIFKRFKTTETSIMLDKLKDLGFQYSTIAGFTVALSDVIGLDNKDDIIAESDAAVEKIRKAYNRGRMTDQERYRKVIEIWTKTKAEIYDGLQVSLNENHKENSIFMMMDSGARGNISNFGQLAGMRGLMAKPNGESIEIPIKSSFIEGLSVSEFFTSTHGARKGLADTALKTADSGYLTRRLVDVAQDVIIRELDCGTDEGLKVRAIINTKDNTEIEPLERRIVGRYTNKKVFHPETGELLADRNELITEEVAAIILEAGITEVEIRSVLSCSTSYGVCQKCYGRNLATGEVVEIGEAIGAIAAQSIGEPGTQLTMRTFHTGGVAGDDITQGLPRVQELFEARNPKARSIISEIEGVVERIEQLDHRYEIFVKNDLEERSYLTPYSARLRVKEGVSVKPGQKLTEGSIDPKELLKVTDVRSVQSYILKEIQKVYSMQGVEISDKHVEVMSRRMLSKLRIIDPGSTPFLPGALVDMSDFTRENRNCLIAGKNPAIGRPVLLGITKASLETESFLSAASFQETTRVLTDAAIKGKTDRLMGLKENVIIGKLIPAGTGAKMYREVDLKIDRPEVEEVAEFEEIVE